ncbi:MAG: Bax inhibitor-1 family protein [Bacilli bacterium]|nr:Bax inhibitor-1 family protein [Bacilli bacterium]
MDISDRDRDAFHPEYQQTKVVNGDTSGTTLSIAKVFLFMFIGLLITAVVAFGVGALVYYYVGVYDAEAVNDTVLRTYLIMIIVSAVALIIDMIVINFVVIRGKHSVLVPGIIYTILVGVLFSMLTIVVDWRIIGMAFGITAATFALMSLIAFLTKGNLRPLVIVIIGLAVGVGALALFNWIFALATGTVISAVFWVVEIGLFALILFVTIYDLWRIKKIAEQGAMNKNISLYCAFIMYTDFINIFLRILMFLLIIFGKRR